MANSNNDNRTQLKKFLDESGIRPVDFARLTGELPQTVNGWINKGIPAAKAIKASATLQIPIEALLEPDVVADNQPPSQARLKSLPDRRKKNLAEAKVKLERTRASLEKMNAGSPIDRELMHQIEDAGIREKVLDYYIPLKAPANQRRHRASIDDDEFATNKDERELLAAFRELPKSSQYAVLAMVYSEHEKHANKAPDDTTTQ